MEAIAAVIGATGKTGKHIVQKLIEENIPVRIFSRNLSKAKKMFRDSVEIVEGDITKMNDLRKLVGGVRYLFAAHGADNEQGDRRYQLIDFGGIEKALQSIPAKQKTHIVYMSSIYVERKNPPYNFPGEPLHWKRKAEQLIQASGSAYTIVRPGWLTNDKGGRLRISADQGDQGDGKISREDVANVMVQAKNFESAKGKTFEVYNVEGVPVRNWNTFFSRLERDVIHD